MSFEQLRAELIAVTEAQVAILVKMGVDEAGARKMTKTEAQQTISARMQWQRRKTGKKGFAL